MKLIKNKKPSFAPRKQELGLKTKLEWIIIIVTLVSWLVDLIKYILSKL